MKNKEYMQWWREARFGMMIHWGLYSVLGGEWKGQRQKNIGEWIMSEFRIPIAEYEQLAAEFNPVAFDADQWARLASRAGMKYLIITAKHHDGFAMYHSKCDPYNIVDATPFGRDPMAELAEACQKHGVKLCFYYSQSLDWHEFGGGGFDAEQPNFEMSWCNNWDFQCVRKRDFDDYFDRKVIPQVTELLTGYGPVGAIWFDCPFTISLEQSQQLYELVKSLQPDCIVNSRLGNGLGDYGSFGDNQISGQVMEGDWETVATLNDTWGYKSFDTNWKSAEDVLALLTGSASMNVNYVLNIGPTGEGMFPSASIDVLNGLGDWMELHSESIHGTLPTPFLDSPRGVTVTQKPGKLYLHMHQPLKRLSLNGLHNTVKRAYLLHEPGVDLVFQQKTDSASGQKRLAVELPDMPQSVMCPVLAVEFDGLAEVDNVITQQPDGTITLPAASARIDNTGVEASSVASIGSMGAVVNWYSPNTSLSWDFMVSEAGVYELSMITTGLHHSNPWTGGHKVRLQVGDAVISAVVQQDELIDDVAARYYTQAVSVLGRLTIDSPGRHQLTLIAEDIQFNNGVGLAVMSVSLRKVTPVIL
ncbi:MAG: alpha-L-fucosidase [Armatimonadota bacterium]